MTTRRLKEWTTKHIRAIRIVIVLAMLLLAVWAITLSRYDLVIGSSELALWLTEALVMVGPEFAGIVIGVVVIDALNDWRQDNQLKEQLILQMGSRHNDVTDTAVRTLRARGWLEDGSLKGANLSGANLQGASLWEANLQGAYLYRADLQGANLWEANLQRARLGPANLSGAGLYWANLQGANLHRANLIDASLVGANLVKANLQGARLEDANLEDANLEGARLVNTNLQEAKLWGTTMPDNIKLKGPNSPEGPTFEEWLAMQDGQEEEE